jgi:hypothetical protein
MNDNPTPNPSPTFFTFCKICECRLYTPEEWHNGLCTFHAAGLPRPTYSDPNWTELLSIIDRILDEAPTGVIPRPNRDS